MESFATELDLALPSIRSLPHSPGRLGLLARTEGWVGGRQRLIEVCSANAGVLLRVDGAGEFFVDSKGETIGRTHSGKAPSQLECEIILGPALVLALALRSTWSLHASAAMFMGRVIVFLGESGRGKSTLAWYLSQCAGWQLVADDILPVRMETSGVEVWPHFPQLKLPAEAQPSLGLPGKLPVGKVCILTPTEGEPELKPLRTMQGVQALLRHTAGTRLFGPELLSAHLDFCTQAAGKLEVYRLSYPHRRSSLPLVKGLLEGLC